MQINNMTISNLCIYLNIIKNYNKQSEITILIIVIDKNYCMILVNVPID